VRWLAATALVVASCGSAGVHPVTPSSVLDQTVACEGVTDPVRIEHTIRLRLIAGGGIAPEAVLELAEGIQEYFTPYGITFEIDDTIQVETTTLLGGNLATIEQRLRSSLTTADSTAGQAIVVDVALAPVRSFLERNATPPQQRIDLVLLEQVAAGDSVAAGLIGDVAGLGLGPEASMQLPDRALPRQFTPTVFLAQNVLTTMTEAQRAIVASHEIAHAIGLGHDQRLWNLMHPDVGGCLPALALDQVESIAAHPAVRGR
jgi:hypothetical protein